MTAIWLHSLALTIALQVITAGASIGREGPTIQGSGLVPTTGEFGQPGQLGSLGREGAPRTDLAHAVAASCASGDLPVCRGNCASSDWRTGGCYAEAANAFRSSSAKVSSSCSGE